MNSRALIQLSVNLNKVALIRNSREGNHPDILEFGRLCLEAGASGLTVHPRPDQRHIRASDCQPLAELVSDFPEKEFNIEGNPFAAPKDSYPGLIELVSRSRPHQCTLVPDTDGQLTSDHGFDLTRSGEKLTPIIEELKQLGVRVSLFMDPDLEQITLAKQVGADRIELYTGPFAWAYERSQEEGKTQFRKHCEAAEFARSIGLGINAGHDLNLDNMLVYANLPGLQEVSIGHALTVDALKMGFEKTVKAYLAVCGYTK